MSPIFSVSQPATFNTTEFLSTATDSFTNHLGLASCSRPGRVINVAPATVTATPTASIPSLLTPVNYSPKQNSTQANPTGTTTPDVNFAPPVPTIAVAVTISVAFLGMVLLAFLMYARQKAQKKLRKEAEGASSQNNGSPHENTQPYLQQKAELEAEENRKHELEAQERTYEMGSEGERYELPTGKQDAMIRARQELRGEEHSKELDVPR